MDINARIRTARLEQNMTLKDLAMQVGVSPTAAGNWDSGKSRPREDMLERIASVLGVEADYLRYGDGDGTSQSAAIYASSVQEILAEAKFAIAKRTGVQAKNVELRLIISA